MLPLEEVDLDLSFPDWGGVEPLEPDSGDWRTEVLPGEVDTTAVLGMEGAGAFSFFFLQVSSEMTTNSDLN